MIPTQNDESMIRSLFRVGSSMRQARSGSPSTFLVRDGNGELVEDRREASFQLPQGVFDTFAALGPQAGELVVDVGARDARHTIRLVREHSLRAVALDPMPFHCELARQAVAEAGLDGEIDVVEGAIESLPFSRESSEVFDRPSINLGRIEGGDAINKVPDECRMSVDIRFLPGQDPDAILDQNVVREIVQSYGGKLTVASTVGVGTMFRFDLPLSS